MFPFALPYRTVIVASLTTNASSPRKTRIFSCNIADSPLVEFKISESLTKSDPIWGNYVKGTIFQYIKEIPEGASFDAVITSDVPIGSGLSSSASLE